MVAKRYRWQGGRKALQVSAQEVRFATRLRGLHGPGRKILKISSRISWGKSVIFILKDVNLQCVIRGVITQAKAFGYQPIKSCLCLEQVL